MDTKFIEREEREGVGMLHVGRALQHTMCALEQCAGWPPSGPFQIPEVAFTDGKLYIAKMHLCFFDGPLHVYMVFSAICGTFKNIKIGQGLSFMFSGSESAPPAFLRIREAMNLCWHQSSPERSFSGTPGTSVVFLLPRLWAAMCSIAKTSCADRTAIRAKSCASVERGKSFGCHLFFLREVFPFKEAQT